MSNETAIISSDELVAEISTLGAELQQLTDRNDRQLLWNGDASFWTGRAPILFPIIGVLEHGQYRLDGHYYEMPKHGFARHSMFEIIESEPSAATFRLISSDDTRVIYPFEFILDIRFSLERAALTVAANISNCGEVAMPASFGFHPALRWPLPYGHPRADHRVIFEREERAPVRRISTDGLLLAEPERTPVKDNTLILRDALFVDDALIFDRLDSRRVTYGARTGPQIDIDFSDLPVLGVWTKPGAGFICIEPWQGLPDPAGYSGDIRDKPEMIEIAPGTSRRLAMTLSLEGLTARPS